MCKAFMFYFHDSHGEEIFCDIRNVTATKYLKSCQIFHCTLVRNANYSGGRLWFEVEWI